MRLRRTGVFALPFSRRRRRLIQTGVVGAALLGVAPMLRAASVVATNAPASGDYRFLRAHDLRVLRAVVPVMLAGALPSDDPDPDAAMIDIFTACDLYLTHLGAADRRQVRRLFDLLNVSVARVVLAGVWDDWGDASADAINGFLHAWQHSNVTLFYSGYRVIRDLVMSGWYGNAASWPAIGYAGPPDIKR